MKKISLTNFLRMSPDAPEYSSKNQHYSMSGVNPTYYLESVGTLEEQNAPLIASNMWSEVTASGIGGQAIVGMCESSIPDYDYYCISSTGIVSGVNVYLNSRLNLGLIPSYTTDNFKALKCFAGVLIGIPTYTGSVPLYSSSLTTASTWASLPGSPTITGMTAAAPAILENFAEYCMVSSGALVQKINTSLAISSGLNFGTGNFVLGMKNYNDKYLAVVVSNAAYTGTKLNLWDGTSPFANYSVLVPGKYIDMTVIEGMLYVACQETGTGNVSGQGRTSVFYLKGTQLVPLMTPQISKIYSGNTNGGGSLFNFNNKLGINLESNDLMIYGKEAVGNVEYILSNQSLPFTKFIQGSNGYLIAANAVSSKTYFYNYASSTYNQINYNSLWIPVKNLSGIDIVYDTPPKSGTDAINVTINGVGEDIISGMSTNNLGSITPTNILNNMRTRFDVQGFAGSEVQIVLTTVNTGSWRPIIRQVDLITE